MKRRLVSPPLLFVLGAITGVDNAEELSGQTCHLYNKTALVLESEDLANSSLAEFLNPHVLEGYNLAKIRENLLAGKLVVVRDAFKTEFAEYAASAFDTDVDFVRQAYYVRGDSTLRTDLLSDDLMEEAEVIRHDLKKSSERRGNDPLSDVEGIISIRHAYEGRRKGARKYIPVLGDDPSDERFR